MEFMFVTLEVLKLSGWLNALANCRESNKGHTVWGEVHNTGRREAAGDHGARSVQRRARLQVGSRARGGAHPEHGLHVRDAGGVEAQRLVERPRFLPIVERRAYVRCGARVQASRRGRRRPARAGEGSTADWDRTGVERTRNIWDMSVTLEVSKLSDWLNADACCRESKEGHVERGEVCGSGAAGGGRPRRTQLLQGRARLQIGGQGRGRSARRTWSPWL